MTDLKLIHQKNLIWNSLKSINWTKKQQLMQKKGDGNYNGEIPYINLLNIGLSNELEDDEGVLVACDCRERAIPEAQKITERIDFEITDGMNNIIVIEGAANVPLFSELPGSCQKHFLK